MFFLIVCLTIFVCKVNEIGLENINKLIPRPIWRRRRRAHMIHLTLLVAVQVVNVVAVQGRIGKFPLLAVGFIFFTWQCDTNIL